MKLTREGKRFVVATVLIAIAAFNTGNNLIYLILSLMLSILFLAVLILKVNMNKVALSVSQVQPVFANSPAFLNIALSNKKKKISAYSIKASASEKIGGSVYFSKVKGMSDELKTIPVIYKKRGVYSFGDFSIESSFPFIFFSKKDFCRVEGDVIVYPEIIEKIGRAHV
jgi:uncharacterized protein (DUF58 family)